jgi:hypothetical protein
MTLVKFGFLMGETLCTYVVQRRQIENIDELNKNENECHCEKMINFSSFICPHRHA